MSHELNDLRHAIETTQDNNSVRALQATLKIHRINSELKNTLSVRAAVELFLSELRTKDSTIDINSFADSNQFEAAWFYFYTVPAEPSIAMSFHA